MAGFLDQFRKKVTSGVWNEQSVQSAQKHIDDKIALGVLLWAVAEADETFLPQEEEKIKQILKDFGKISVGDMPVVLRSIKEAADQRIDLYRFTREVAKDLTYNVKLSIVENLFRVACADKDLDHNEIEIIRKISGLLGVDHKEFIDAKLKVKKEFGLEVY